MPHLKRAKILAFFFAGLLSVLSTALAMASDGRVPFPK